eukprot:g6981.t1
MPFCKTSRTVADFSPQTFGNPRTNAKFVVATQVAGWIIGKQGRHIRELQDNSGAHIQVMKEGEVPPGVPATDRIVEIGGRPDAKAEGIQIILIAVDSMPAMSAPRETLMLIPRPLTTEAEVKDPTLATASACARAWHGRCEPRTYACPIKDVQQMSGCEIEVRDLPSHDEGLCTLIGTLEARVKAAQQFLKRLEEVIGDGPMPSSFPPAAPREEKTEANDWSKAPLSDRKDCSTRRRPEDDPWSRSDPWSRGAATGVKDSSGGSLPSPGRRPGSPLTTILRSRTSKPVMRDAQLQWGDGYSHVSGRLAMRERRRDPESTERAEPSRKERVRQLQREHAENGQGEERLLIGLMVFFVLVMLGTGIYAVRIAHNS